MLTFTELQASILIAFVDHPELQSISSRGQTSASMRPVLHVFEEAQVKVLSDGIGLLKCNQEPVDGNSWDPEGWRYHNWGLPCHLEQTLGRIVMPSLALIKIKTEKVKTA
jgi:hypothetical protein